MDSRTTVERIGRGLERPLGLAALVVAVDIVGAAPALLAGPDTA
ncbi:hypothetical protein [Halobaculum sp. MBLA0143]